MALTELLHSLCDPSNFVNWKFAFVVSVIGSLGFIAFLVWSSKNAHLDHIPGPWLARYSNLHAWIEAQRWHGTNVCYLQRLHEKYGDVVRVAPGRVSVCDPDAVPTIYGMRASLDKANLIRAAQPVKGGPDNLFSVRDAKTHAPMRRAVANAYANTTITQYEPRVDAMLEKFFEVVEDEGLETNIGKWVRYYVYDVQGNMTYGEPLGYLEKRGDALNLISQTKTLMKYVQLTMPMPILHDIGSFLLQVFRVQKGTAFFHVSASRVRSRLNYLKSISAEESKKIEKNDILGHFIASREKFPELMTDAQIITHCMINVLAGTSTSTMSIINVIKYLVDNPAAQERLYRELREANASYPATWRETQQVPFLEGLVREGVRLRGVDGFNPNGRVVGPDGMILPNGMYLPPGTVVGIKPSVASVQVKTFGENPYAFLPARWERRAGETEEAFNARRIRMDRGDLSFSTGTRGCIGRNIAMMEIYKLLAVLVSRYKLHPPSGQHQINDRFDLFCTLVPRKD